MCKQYVRLQRSCDVRQAVCCNRNVRLQSCNVRQAVYVIGVSGCREVVMSDKQYLVIGMSGCRVEMSDKQYM